MTCRGMRPAKRSVDSRILTFTDMGFGADEAERALRDAGNDVDKGAVRA